MLIISSYKLDMETVEQKIREIFNKQSPTFHGKTLRIKNIIPITNPILKSKFIKDNCKLLFHGTPLENIESICNNGFCKKPGMLGHIGNGIYFSDLIDQSLYYQLKYEYTGDETFFRLLVCKVSIGNCIYKERIYSRAEEFDILADSHKTNYKDQNGKMGIEYVCEKYDRILPVYILEMECD